jgi:hypothetical protein
LPSRVGSRLGRPESSPWSAACVTPRRPWMEACATWREPRCRSPLSSRRCTHRWEEVVQLARSPHRRLCSCTAFVAQWCQAPIDALTCCTIRH